MRGSRCVECRSGLRTECVVLCVECVGVDWSVDWIRAWIVLCMEWIRACFVECVEWIGACFIKCVEWIGAWIVQMFGCVGVWIVPFGSVCGSEQSSSVCV